MLSIVMGYIITPIWLYNVSRGVNYMDILDKIDALRQGKGWSINYLAIESGLTQSTLNNIYTRKNEPKISTLRAICDAFGITLSDFFRDESNDDELIEKVRLLSKENKMALLQLLKSIK